MSDNTSPQSCPNKLKSAREHLKTMGVDHFDGVPYYAFMKVKECMSSFAEQQTFEDDVICCGFPRSGNRWTFEVVHMLMSQSEEFAKIDLLARLIEYAHGDVAKMLTGVHRPRQLASHVQMSTLLGQALSTRPRLVYILRNPKDVLVSWYRFMSHVTKGYGFLGSWPEFFELMLTGELPWGSWFDHVLDAEKFIQEHPNYPLFILQFEKMKERPVEVIKELCHFLNLPDNMAETIAVQTSMETMAAGVQDKLEKLTMEWFKQNVIHSTGTFGVWKDHFTVDQSQRFDQMFEWKMKGSHLGAMVRPYIMDNA